MYVDMCNWFSWYSDMMAVVVCMCVCVCIYMYMYVCMYMDMDIDENVYALYKCV